MTSTCTILSMSNHHRSSTFRGSLASRLTAAAGGLAVALTAAAGVASADPGLDAAINTTCSYPQVTAAMNAESPEAAAEFNESAMAQSWLQRFLASPPEKRQQMAEQAQAMPGAQQYIGLVSQIVSTCNNY